MKKIFSLFLCFILSLTILGCSDTSTTGTTEVIDATQGQLSDLTEDTNAVPTATPQTQLPQPTPNSAASTTLFIACSNKGFNPYLTSDTIVEQTASLLFENFIAISPDFELEYRLAEQIDNNGTLVTITLRSNCTFADGTPITAQDAAQSLFTATQSSAYSKRFANVAEISASDNEIFITLFKPDSLFAYLLDIPVLKEIDLQSATPTASGRYTYGARETLLVQNAHAPFASDGPTNIELVPVANYDDMISALALGNINYTTQGEYTANDISSISSTEYYYKNNILLFLGVNAFSQNTLCNTSEGRNLLSALINRDTLATDVYDARAYAARGALNPFYPFAKDAQCILPTSDDSALADTMLHLGYSYNTQSAFYENEAGERATVSILLHTSNTYKTNLANEIAAEWTKNGIETAVFTTSDFNSFLTMLESGEFELYIGEMKLYNNIELSSFWEGSANYGILASDALLQAYTTLRADATTAIPFETAFAADMPYIPLLWRNGVVLTSRTTSGVSASISDPFYALGEFAFSS